MRLPALLQGRRFLIYAFLIVAAACGIRFLLADRYAGFVTDQSLFVQWMETIRRYGLGEAYPRNGSINYPPLFPLLLDLYGEALNRLGIAVQAGSLSFKGVLLAIDLAAMLAAVKLTAGAGGARWRLIVLALFALNPAFIADSAVWGQVDLLHSMLMVLAVVAMPRRPWLSGLWAGFALLAKFQAVTVLPVVGTYLLVRLVRGRSFREAAGWLIGFAAPLGVAAAYFARAGSLSAMFRQAYADAVGQYASATVNAANVWFHLLGVDPSASDSEPYWAGLTLRTIGLLLFGAVTAFVCLYIWIALKDPEKERAPEAVLLKAAAAIGFAFFMLPTEIHERYGIPAIAFALFAALYDRRWIAAAGTLTVTMLVNVLAVLRSGRRGFGRGGRNGGGFRPGGGRGWSGGSVPDAGMSEGGTRHPDRGFAGRGDGGLGGFPFGGGPGTTLSSGYVWVAAVNALLLIWLLWALWREMSAVRATVRESVQDAPAAH
ncbi:DUF2029 domain-containing protein [Cohnella sp. CFH 77786]|uniref:glycosyltransferase family 87 protein n=1 Tax=Cohnella sp. CFH 77786 TaxID=2662265 RepID=UPI001C60A399|nr:glycosyltransferase family 87 protein [Cohnella sp. CFH 77786]MBW5448865.1 DUF2029 domain-containing protein [Cohnella sp. CFH 77786]